jgi:hypothetical protein
MRQQTSYRKRLKPIARSADSFDKHIAAFAS